MHFASHRPGPPLDAFVDHFWYFDHLVTAHPMERVLPNGAFTLIFNLDETPRCLFPRDPGGSALRFRRAWVSGAHSGYIVIDSPSGSSLMGVHFLPGGAARFFGMPAGHLRDAVVELDAIWGHEADTLRQALVETPTPRAKFALLERQLLARHNLAKAPDPLVQHALQQFLDAPHLARIDHVARSTGLSHRSFIERFERVVGLSPKRYCRILRFQHVLRRLGGQAPVSWASVAADCGYYDQAHFIQEFRTFSGLVPTRYPHERGEYLGFIPLSAEMEGTSLP